MDDIEAGKIPFKRRIGHAPPVQLSEAVQSLIRRTLRYDPEERPKIREVRGDAWFATAMEASAGDAGVAAEASEATATATEPAEETQATCEDEPRAVDAPASTDDLIDGLGALGIA